MKAIDFRFRPNTPDAVDGLIHSPFFGDMCAFFNYPRVVGFARQNRRDHGRA